MGERSVGESSVGERSVGESSVGESSVGERSVGERSVGESSVGERSVGERSVGERSVVERSIGERSVGDCFCANRLNCVFSLKPQFAYATRLCTGSPTNCKLLMYVCSHMDQSQCVNLVHGGNDGSL